MLAIEGTSVTKCDVDNCPFHARTYTKAGPIWRECLHPTHPATLPPYKELKASDFAIPVDCRLRLAGVAVRLDPLTIIECKHTPPPKPFVDEEGKPVNVAPDPEVIEHCALSSLESSLGSACIATFTDSNSEEHRLKLTAFDYDRFKHLVYTVERLGRPPFLRVKHREGWLVSIECLDKGINC